jgi:multicomponent Na+:H+ antiporter subunit D
MLTVPALLLLGALVVGVVPAIGTQLVRAVDEAVPGADTAVPGWTLTGVLLGLLSAALACGLALLAVLGPRRSGGTRDLTEPLRRLHSGHIGDYVAWMLVGMTLLGALVLPGISAG